MLEIKLGVNGPDEWAVVMLKIGMQGKGSIEVVGQVRREVALAVKIIDHRFAVQLSAQYYMVIPDQWLMFIRLTLSKQGNRVIFIDNE